MRAPYDPLAQLYHTSLLDGEYKKYVDLIVKKVKDNAPVFAGADGGCGSGIVTRALKKAGAGVWGFDISYEMVEKAVTAAKKDKLNVTFLKQNLLNFKSFEKLGFLTVINDGLNYIDPKNLTAAFKNFNKNMVKKGALVFDISTPYKLKTVLGNNVYGDDGEDLSYIWFNTLGDGFVDIEITFFEKKGEVYVRTEETQRQYIHEIEDVYSALKDAGFTLRNVCDDLGGELKSDSMRAVFTAIKN